MQENIYHLKPKHDTFQPDKISYTPRPGFQTKAFRGTAQYKLIGGQAGPGKSWFLVFDPLYDGSARPDPLPVYLHPKYTAVLLRREFIQTEQLRREATPLYEGHGFRWRGHPENAYRHKSGSKIYVRHMQNLEDWNQFQGWEIHYLGFDELTQFEESQVAGVLPWLRSTITYIKPRFCATTNPEGIGLEWVKRWWEIKCPCPEHENENPMFWKVQDIGKKQIKTSWHFIPGTRKGSVIEEKDPEYEGRLALMCGGVNSARYKAIGRGCWEVAKGAFWTEFSNVHIIPNDFRLPDEWGWSTSGGHDFATSPDGDAAAFVMGSVSNKRDIVVEHEWYGWGHGVIEQGKAFKPLYDQCSRAFSGSDIFARDQGGRFASIADQFAIDCKENGEGAVVFTNSSKKDENAVALIRAGFMATIYNRDGCILIRERCTRLIEDLKILQAEPKEFKTWDTKHRITVNKRRYHFDVFQAFRQLVCGVSEIVLPKTEEVRMHNRRQKAIEERSRIKESLDCSYSV